MDKKGADVRVVRMKSEEDRKEGDTGLMDDGQPQIAIQLFDHHFESNESLINAKRFTFMLDMIDVAICKY